MSNAVKTTCAYCGVGCGIIASQEADGTVTISGDDQHPANLGRLCSKGSALGETVGLKGRLLEPKVHGDNVKWDTALSLVADTFKSMIKKHGPDSVAFYVSGQLLTEDYYVANKLMKGFIGSANIDTNSRLCMSSSVAGHKRAFGEDIVPGCYDDLEQADLLVLVGSNAAWCHPVLYQRMIAAKENEPSKKIVILDPRGTTTSESADLHLAIKPGTDAYVFNGLLAYLAQKNAIDIDYIRQQVDGAAEAISAAIETCGNISDVAKTCGVSVEKLQQFYQWFLTIEKTVTLYSQGVNQSVTGSDKVNAILNVHLATGRIGKIGQGPFSLTGQPNAMGGREVGGLANMLAAHMDIENPDHRQIVGDFWQSDKLPTQPGLKAVDMFKAVADGKIKAIWIMGTNPAVSMPEAGLVEQALHKCEFVVVSDVVENTQTTKTADVLLPALAWGEKDGTVTNSERRISRQRAFLSAPGKAKADWWIISEVAKRMGFAQAFTYSGPVDIFTEYAALTASKNTGERILNLKGLKHLSLEGYNDLMPVQWPYITSGTKRIFDSGFFATQSGKANMLAIAPVQPSITLSRDYPLVLNTGRVRDQWHTMTRTGKSQRLASHTIEPYVEIHPLDAMRAGVEDQTLINVSSPLGYVIMRAKFSTTQQKGSVFAPIHWSRPFAKEACISSIIDARTDIVSGQPELKQTAVQVAPYKPAWHAFVLSSVPVETEYSLYRVAVQGDGFQWFECAGEQPIEDWDKHAKSLLGAEDGDEWATYQDVKRGIYRHGLLRNGRLIACLFVSKDHHLVPRHWLAGLINKPLETVDRASLLSGRPTKAQDVGATICACFGIGTTKIIEVIKNQGLTSVKEIGDHLQAGTNCGSCKPELANLLKKTG